MTVNCALFGSVRTKLLYQTHGSRLILIPFDLTGIYLGSL